jgi:glycosyltransferase involved in cell wall biosynthesis/peptidoglycan/xylan/chitin deacetylase (PgdA/CDA1 family)
MKAGISVVIPYAGSRTFADMLTSLARQTLAARRFDVIVATELAALSPELMDRLSGIGASVVYFRRPQNFHGHSAGILRNAGVAKARRQILLFVDSDAVLAPDCLANHLRLQQEHRDHVICGSWRELPIDSQHLLRGGSSAFGKLFGRSLRDYRAQLNRPAHWENLYSGNVSIPRQLFLRVEGFDDQGHRCHDLDLGYRLFRAGARFRYSPECQAVHIEHPRSISFRAEQANGWRHLATRFPEIQALAEERANVLERSFKRTAQRCEQAFRALTGRLPGIRLGTRWIVPASLPEKDVTDALVDYTRVLQEGGEGRRYFLRLERNCWDYSVVHPHGGVLDKPQISVLLTTADSEHVVGRALASVLEQFFQSFEVVVVDDASSDGTERLIRTLAIDGRIRLFVNAERRGLARSLNRALEAARAPIVLQLDADDWLEPEALQAVVQHFADHPATGGVYACAYIHSGDQVILDPGYQIDSDVEMLSYKPVQAPRAYRTKILRDLGGWSIQDVFDGRFFEDRLTLSRVQRVARVDLIDRALYHVDQRPQSLSRRHPRRTAAAKFLILSAEANQRRMELEAKWTRSGVSARLIARSVPAPRRAWSIIIISHGRAELLDYALRSWLESDVCRAEAEIIVVDDGSPQPLSKIVRTSDERVRFVRILHRAGPAQARNLGVRHARNEMLFFADGDQIVPPDVLASHERRHDRCAQLSVVVGGLFGRKTATCVNAAEVPAPVLHKLLDQLRFDRKRLLRLAEAAIFGGVVDLLGRDSPGSLWQLVEPLSFADPYLARWLSDAVRHGDVARGPFGFLRLRTGNLSMSAASFHAVGGFDCSMQTMQDWEFGLRCQKVGIPIVSAPEIEPYHQLHPADFLRPELNRSSRAHFKTKHPDTFSFFDHADGAHIPGIDILRGKPVDQPTLPRGSAQADSKPGFIALTFDDGPHPVGTPRLLQELTTHQARATFFVLGANAARYPEILREVAAAGCEIGVHGWEHTPSAEQTPEEIVHDLRRTASAIVSITGVRPRFCRPPYGKTSPQYLRAAMQARLTPVGWDVSTRDWRSVAPSDLIMELATKRLLGKVLLFHDGAGDLSSTVEVLAWLLSCGRKYGVQAASLSEAQQHTSLPVLPAARGSRARATVEIGEVRAV